MKSCENEMKSKPPSIPTDGDGERSIPTMRPLKKMTIINSGDAAIAGRESRSPKPKLPSNNGWFQNCWVELSLSTRWMASCRSKWLVHKQTSRNEQFYGCGAPPAWPTNGTWNLQDVGKHRADQSLPQRIYGMPWGLMHPKKVMNISDINIY